MKKPILIILGVLLVGFVVYAVASSSKSDLCCGPSSDATGGMPGIPNVISVSDLAAGQAISSPLTVHGQARGTWYFEAVFPVAVLDSQGKVIGQGHAQAGSDWMTEGFVPFSATVSFAKPPQAGAVGKVVLEKDNPSGMPENEQSLEIPIIFK